MTEEEWDALPCWKKRYYDLKSWWWFNMDPHNCCGLLHKLIEWRDEKLAKWLTPHLKNARKLLNLCIQENGTKLLSYTANSFYIRTRDESQWYFEGKAGFFGKVTITRSQLLDEDGKPQNRFMTGIANALSDEKEQKTLIERSDVVFSGWVLTKKQLERAEDEITQHVEFGWDWKSIALARMSKKLHLSAEKAWEWEKQLEEAILKRDWNGVKIWDLSEDDYKKFEAGICSMTVEEADALVWSSQLAGPEEE